MPIHAEEAMIRTPPLLLAAVPVMLEQLVVALTLQGRVIRHVRLRVEGFEGTRRLRPRRTEETL